MRRYFSITALVLWLSAPFLLWARIPASPGNEDIRNFAEHAPLVFRGQVVQLNLTKSEPGRKEGIAIVAVDRWYRGGQLPDSSRVRVHFAYGSSHFIQGHDCVDLVLDSHWIFFAQPNGEAALELFHDCDGALAVSPLLAPQLPDGVLAQMEADFRAGLRDSSPEARLASIQRLAGLALPVSREALHEQIAYGTEIESRWAIFAALKTDDASALSFAKPMLMTLRSDRPGPHLRPEWLTALAVQKLRAPEAVPDLIEILNGASDELVRDCASYALMEIKDPRALEAFASHLSDPSQGVRYNSLIGIQYITHAPACTVEKPEDAEKAIPGCKAWWASSSKP